MRNLGGVAPTEPRTFQVPVLPYPVGHAEILADNYLSLWGRPLQFASFEMVANDDVRLLTLRGLRLWDQGVAIRRQRYPLRICGAEGVAVREDNRCSA